MILDVDGGTGRWSWPGCVASELRTKVDLDLATWGGWALRGPAVEQREALGAASLVLPADWPGVESVDLLAAEVPPLPASLPELPAEALEVLRIECGVPAMGAELTESTIPAEAGQWLIDASVSFTKGCYTGQELVARIDSRGGNVPRPLRGVLVDGDPVPVGAEVRSGGNPVGTVTSSARSAALGAVALAPLARSVEPGSVLEVAWSGGTAAATAATLPLR